MRRLWRSRWTLPIVMLFTAPLGGLIGGVVGIMLFFSPEPLPPKVKCFESFELRRLPLLPERYGYREVPCNEGAGG